MTQPTCTITAAPVLYGTRGDDRLHIAKAEGADGLKGLYKVELNGQSRLMTAQELEDTRFELGAGNDSVVVERDVTAKIHVDGGTGTTQVKADNGNVVMVGDGRDTPLPKPFQIPGTPLVVEPLEAPRNGESLSVFGMELPFRAARISNAGCITAMPGQQPGQSVSVPPFAITVRADRAGMDVTGSIPLSLRPGVASGTPLNHRTDEANVRRDEVIRPSVAVGTRVYGTATLSKRDDYPRSLVDPTEVSLTALSNDIRGFHPKLKGDFLEFGDIGRLRAEAFGVGGAKVDVTAKLDLKRVDAALAPLKLNDGEAKALRNEIVGIVASTLDQARTNPAAPDPRRIESSLRQAIAHHVPPGTKPAAIDKALEGVLSELTHPGVTAKGPMFLGLPVGYGYFSADTLRHVRAPLDASGIGTPFPATLATVGPTLIPAGVIKDYATPALGATVARDGERHAVSATAAAKPSLEPGSIGVEGVAAVRGGFRLAGFDVTLEAGWRGRAALSSGKEGHLDKSGRREDPIERDFRAIGTARHDAELRAIEQAKGSEQGVFRSDRLPPEVLGSGRPSNEGFIGVKVKKSF
jgi:hypothetical protein